MKPSETLMAAIAAIPDEQLRQGIADQYYEDLSSYKESELRQLVFDIWVTDGCEPPLSQQTPEKVRSLVLRMLDFFMDTEDADELSDEQLLADFDQHVYGELASGLVEGETALEAALEDLATTFS